MGDTIDLAEGVLAGQTRAIARLISRIENGSPSAVADLARLYGATGRAMTVGVTGPPGAGKSTFVDRLVSAIRVTGRTVAVIAVDPMSPFSGGAILGDRVRMCDHGADAGVYIRSMSSRGHLGGIALATEATVNVLDAAGFAVVIVETVGVGQSEIEVAELADTTVLVQPPGLGDGVQAVKAGIMEVPDLFVVNKADLAGAKQAAAEIREYLGLVEPVAGEWQPPVVLVAANREDDPGVAAVWEAMQAHWEHLGLHDRLALNRGQRAATLLWREAERQMAIRLRRSIPSEAAAAVLKRITNRELSPAEAAKFLLDTYIDH